MSSAPARDLYKKINVLNQTTQSDAPFSDCTISEYFKLIKDKSGDPELNALVDRVEDQNLSTVMKMVFAGTTK